MKQLLEDQSRDWVAKKNKKIELFLELYKILIQIILLLKVRIFRFNNNTDLNFQAFQIILINENAIINWN